MNIYMLLDRSGSMQTRWDEALKSLNVYVDDLAKNDATKNASVTLAVFDGLDGLQFDTIRNGVDAAQWSAVSSADAAPRGMTPLFDAIGRIVAMAEGSKADKAVVVVMTDGAENASREVTQAGAKAAFNRLRAKGYQVVFLGADFNAFNQAESVGTQSAQTINATAGNYANATRAMAQSSARYAATGATMDWSDEDRRLAQGKK